MYCENIGLNGIIYLRGNIVKKKNHVIKYLRIGSKLVNKHTGKTVVIIEKSEHGYKFLEINGSTLSSCELKEDMGLYFKKLKK